MKKVAILLYPDIPVFQFSVPYAIFTEAVPPDLFDVKLVAQSPKIHSKTMRYMADVGLDYLAQADIIIVAGWADLNTPPTPKITKALQAAYARGAYLVGLCYGAYALAYTGVLDGKTAATHWLAEQDFAERFPKISLDNNALYLEDERIITSAGTSAALDCCLYLVRKFYGAKIANHTARIMVTPPHREGGQAQFIEQTLAEPNKDKHLNALLDYLHANLHLPHSIDSLAQKTHISRRTFTRHFYKMTGQSLTQWLINARLQKSLELLESSTLSIEQIADEIGFQSAVSFRTHFKAKFEVSPSQWRKVFVGSSPTKNPPTKQAFVSGFD
ncbi:AraC family transcriptional regulator [Moraxella caviae]|uniref:AraC family transcriptional regulator n=1 Tax=Moraxella caviae TaxID=34060 RepID=A0A1T0A9S9_9GAMM|nr:helix-turn-helix domain-containing protein [Moraxella caviae]OOR92463.1 AraC family transcriptional regulator [Moraxella caviae]STZ13830.1 L-rhamnose operon transcriptional activator rhaR [Moraxella caviae]VEW12910.1 L-rhamnose operon transcriptional activator rhaR [Moraxella caviae]